MQVFEWSQGRLILVRPHYASICENLNFSSIISIFEYAQPQIYTTEIADKTSFVNMQKKIIKVCFYLNQRQGQYFLIDVVDNIFGDFQLVKVKDQRYDISPEIVKNSNTNKLSIYFSKVLNQNLVNLEVFEDLPQYFRLKT